MQTIADDPNEKILTRTEAQGLYNSLASLEICFIALFWNDILNRFNVVNKTLQSASVELSNVVELYNSLITFVSKMRDSEGFDYYEKKAIQNVKLTFINAKLLENGNERKNLTSRIILMKQFFQVEIIYALMCITLL